MKTKKEEIAFGLLNIKTEAFYIDFEKYSKETKVEIRSNIKFKIDHKTQKNVSVLVKYEFVQNEAAFISMNVICEFEIKEESWKGFSKGQNNKIIVPKEFLAKIATITTDTARGILFSKTENTSFSKFFIPVFDLTKIISQDISFDETKSKSD